MIITAPKKTFFFFCLSDKQNDAIMIRCLPHFMLHSARITPFFRPTLGNRHASIMAITKPNKNPILDEK